MDDRAPSPLKRKYFLILLTLADGQAHGYAIRAAIAERTDGGVDLDPGTLYRLVSRLLEEGLIEESPDRPDPENDDPRRRYYRLTGAGRTAIAAEAARMRDLVEAARERDLLPDAGGSP